MTPIWIRIDLIRCNSHSRTVDDLTTKVVGFANAEAEAVKRVQVESA